MSYAVKEIFMTLQGEGCHAGRASVFCRFAGCNLWSGREADRASASCAFCDTDFVGVDGARGGKYDDAISLADALEACWEAQVRVEARDRRWAVLTGGEPLLQVDQALVDALHTRGFGVALETNGTLLPPVGLDWICVSPKEGNPLQLCSGDELKLVYPQPGCDPARYVDLDFRHFLLQPLDQAGDRRHEGAALAYCLHHPRWRLSLQTHKWLGIP